jgi:hypothetical protein
MSTTVRVALAVAAAGLQGCSFTVGELASVMPGVAAARPRPAGTSRVRGADCIPIVVVAPTRFPSLDRAAAEALADGGTTLNDVVIRYRLSYIPFVFGLGCYVIEGVPS